MFCVNFSHIFPFYGQKSNCRWHISLHRWMQGCYHFTRHLLNYASAYGTDAFIVDSILYADNTTIFLFLVFKFMMIFHLNRPYVISIQNSFRCVQLSAILLKECFLKANNNSLEKQEKFFSKDCPSMISLFSSCWQHR